MKPKVLIVDDEELSPVFLERVLGEHFTFDHASNGESALAAVAVGNPAVILMDVEMPGGMNGYQACRAIKDNKTMQHIPVFFISAHSAAEDRLKAYESGGDDYVSKPFNPEELKHKIGLALASQHKRHELAEKARRAANMAMMSIREAASAGAVLGFLSDIVGQRDYAEIAETTLRALKKFQMEGAVQLRHGAEHLSRNSGGACTAVEDAVLTKMASDNRIVDIGDRSAFNYERASIIVYNMPLKDPELYGRLKDTIVKMAEALDVHMRSLDGVTAATQRGDALLTQRQHHAALARDINTRVKAQRDDAQRALEQLAQRLEAAAAAPAETLKPLLLLLARELQAQAQAAGARGAELETLLAPLCANVQDPQPAPVAATSAAAAAAGTRFNNVELF